MSVLLFFFHFYYVPDWALCSEGFEEGVIEEVNVVRFICERQREELGRQARKILCSFFFRFFPLC